MNILDIIIVAVVVLLCARGVWKGLVRQIMGIIGAVIAFVVAIKFSGVLAGKYLSGLQPTTGHVIMFLGLFLACMIAASLLAALIGKATSAVGLGYLNRMCGGLLGAAKGYFIMVAVILVLVAFLPPKSGLLVESKTLKYVRPMADIISTFAPDSIRSRYDRNINRAKPLKPDQNKIRL